MKSFFEKIYFKLPIIFQNLTLSIYGLYIQKIRHGKYYRSYLSDIKSNLLLNKKEIECLQMSNIKEVISKAKKFVPHYQKTYADISLLDIVSQNDLKKLPYLEKDIFRTLPETLVDDRYNKDKLLMVHTTGTTGTPLQVYCTPIIRKKNYAFYNRYLASVGINYYSKRATFGGRILVPHAQISPPFWRYNFFQKNMIFSSYHLTEKNIPHYINELYRLKPDYIDAYPSSLYTIAYYAKHNNISLRGITKAITTSAETLFQDQRYVIEDAFGVKIYDQYGAAEMCVFIGECSHGSYHIHSDYSCLEFINDFGDDASPGQEAEIVCTGIINDVMPLIRYRIGDRAVLSSKICSCGSSFPVVDTIIGRVDDVIFTPDGRRIGRLSPVLKGFPIKEAQYRQDNIENLDVLLVKDVTYNTNTELNILKALRKRLGDSIKINIIYVDKIDRSSGNKLKSIVSNIQNFKNPGFN